MQKTQAVMDSDFLQGILHNGSLDLFRQLMDEMNVIPVIHPYVADVELQYCEEAQKLIKDGFIKRMENGDFLFAEEDKVLYNSQVWDILDEISEKELPPEKYRDVFRENFRLTEYSIGEVLSELMAKNLKLPLFASNDYGAKRVARMHINSSKYHLEVKNIAELLDQVIDAGTSISWKEMKGILRENRWHKERERLREKYIEAKG